MCPRLVPELVCSNIVTSLEFYVNVLGFSILYQREDEGFAYLEREGAEIMLEQPKRRSFVAGELQYPYGRGLNLQIEVSHVQTLYEAVRSAAAPVSLALEERWYRRDQEQVGNRQFVVQDPDGYLLRFFEDIGTRELGL